MQRQLVSGYIEGFLQREHNGPEHLEELVATLRKLCGREEMQISGQSRRRSKPCRAPPNCRELNAAGHGEQCAHYAGIIARGLNLSDQEVEDVTFAGRVHDVGKLFHPRSNPEQTGRAYGRGIRSDQGPPANWRGGAAGDS